MKYCRMTILAVLLTMVGRTIADNLTVEAVTMNAGETKQVDILLINPTHQYSAFQFDLVLPEGISIAKNDKGKLMATLDEDRKDDHTLNISDRGDGVYRLMTFSMSNAQFSGTEGALVHITLQADSDIGEDSQTAAIQSQVFTEVSGTQYKWEDVTFSIGAGGGDSPEVPDPPVVDEDMLVIDDVSMSAGGTCQVAISLNNPKKMYSAFQFDLLLPEGISIAKNDKGKFIASLNEDRKDDHTLNVSDRGDGVYRLMTFSMSNATFSGTQGALTYVTLQADTDVSNDTKTATVLSQVFTEPNGYQNKWADTNFMITIDSQILVGDVNNDGEVDVLDVLTLVNYIIGKTNNINEQAADMNGDNEVDVLDVLTLVNTIIG